MMGRSAEAPPASGPLASPYTTSIFVFNWSAERRYGLKMISREPDAFVKSPAQVFRRSWQVRLVGEVPVFILAGADHQTNVVITAVFVEAVFIIKGDRSPVFVSRRAARKKPFPDSTSTRSENRSPV
jgi:hypothetical protein